MPSLLVVWQHCPQDLFYVGRRWLFLRFRVERFETCQKRCKRFLHGKKLLLFDTDVLLLRQQLQILYRRRELAHSDFGSRQPLAAFRVNSTKNGVFVWPWVSHRIRPQKVRWKMVEKAHSFGLSGVDGIFLLLYIYNLMRKLWIYCVTMTCGIICNCNIFKLHLRIFHGIDKFRGIFMLPLCNVCSLYCNM